jgi:hypothetical protein
MPYSLDPADIEAVQALVARSTLSSIEQYELHARREQADSPKDAAEVSIAVQQRLDETSFGIRLNADIRLGVGTISASVAGEYELLDGYQPTPRTLQLFANEVGVMTVFPFLREAVSTMSVRVFGQPLLLPTIERGQIALDVDEQ